MRGIVMGLSMLLLAGQASALSAQTSYYMRSKLNVTPTAITYSGTWTTSTSSSGCSSGTKTTTTTVSCTGAGGTVDASGRSCDASKKPATPAPTSTSCTLTCGVPQANNWVNSSNLQELGTSPTAESARDKCMAVASPAAGVCIWDTYNFTTRLMRGATVMPISNPQLYASACTLG